LTNVIWCLDETSLEGHADVTRTSRRRNAKHDTVLTRYMCTYCAFHALCVITGPPAHGVGGPD